MKAKDVFLDFTPLLDITLIILFYFILFANFSGENTAAAEQLAEAEAKMSQADSMIADADSKMADAERMLADAEKLAAEAEDKLAMIEAADSDAAELAKALEELESGENVKLLYASEGIGTGRWTVTVKKGGDILRVFTPQDIDGIAGEMSGLLEGAGYDEDSYIFISYIYENIDITPKNKIDRMFDVLNEEYRGHIFVSETNTSREG